MKIDRYKNKYFSILGDSISTFEGVSSPKEGCYYNLSRKLLSGVTTVSDTWWGIALDKLNARLMVNDSVSEGTVTWNNSYEIQSYGCSDKRTGSLDNGEATPDFIIVALGINDWGRGVKVFDENDGSPSVFFNAYNEMLKNLKNNYPLAEIWCLTIAKSFCSLNSNFKFPYQKGGEHIERYCTAIRQSAEENLCRVIDLYSNMSAYDTVDGFHPNKEGMRAIAEGVLSFITAE